MEGKAEKKEEIPLGGVQKADDEMWETGWK